jgi:hypothetical protein
MKKKPINDSGEVFDDGYLDQFSGIEHSNVHDDIVGSLPEIGLDEDPDGDSTEKDEGDEVNGGI